MDKLSPFLTRELPHFLRARAVTQRAKVDLAAAFKAGFSRFSGTPLNPQRNSRNPTSPAQESQVAIYQVLELKFIGSCPSPGAS